MLRRAGQSLTVVGVLGFFGQASLPDAGTWLASVELPAFFETTTIALPDGGRLTATIPIQRVQRYGGDGRFRTGWFVQGRGGNFAIGLTNYGAVAICNARGRELFIYDLDGRPLGHQACYRIEVGGIPGSVLQPGDLITSGDVTLQRVVPVGRPDASLVAILLVPLWNPLVAWLIGVAGGVMWRCSTPTGPYGNLMRPVRPFRSD